MNIAEFDVNASPNRFVTAYPIGDLHIEKVLFDEARFRRYVRDIVADPHSFWVFVGDAIEGRTPSQKHYDPDVIQDRYKRSDYIFAVQQKLTELFEPLRARPGVVVKGNHDAYQQWVGISQFLASTSGAHYLDAEGMFRANVSMNGKGGRTLLGYARHIIGGGRKPGSKLNAVDEMMLVADADMYFAGHIHDSINRISTTYTLPRRGDLRLLPVPKPKLVAPSFLHPRMEGIVDYSGAKGYPGVDMGLVVLDIDCENFRFTRREMRY